MTASAPWTVAAPKVPGKNSDLPAPGSLRRGRALSGIAIAAWIATTVAFVEPLQAALLNWDDLAPGFQEILGRLSPIALIAFAGLVPLTFASCWFAPDRATALWVALCVALWAQGDCFVWEYGTFDGAPLDWAGQRDKAWLEAMVWFGLLGFALLRAKSLAKHSLRVLAGILVLQCGGLAGAAYENAPFAPRAARSGPVSDRVSELATLSSSANAIVFVLDMVQSDFIAEALRADDFAAGMPEGFVYFRNAASLYRTTQFSLQSILTSHAVPDGVDAMVWRAAAMESSLPAVLARRGFDSRLVTFARQIHCNREIPGIHCTRLAMWRDPSPSLAFESAVRADVSLLFQLGAFRLTPHWLKPRIYDAGAWGIPELYPRLSDPSALAADISLGTRDDLMLLETLIRDFRLEDAAPRFRFFHLHGAHYPNAINANCERLPTLTSDRDVAIETTRCLMHTLNRYFEVLIEGGVYDETLILVVSDHGHPWEPVDPAVAEPPLPKPGRKGAGSLDNWYGGVPMFLAKAPGARGPLRISDRPVSLCDVPATVLDALEITDVEGFDCETVFTPERRTSRWHYRYADYTEQKSRPRNTRYRFQFERIRVDGHSWHPSSWVGQ